nr:MAG TPA: hypothetical protein [Caudoviricetes sp.]
MIDTDRINARSEDERTNWVQRAFFMRNITEHNEGVDPEVMFARVYNTAMMKFTDTTPGGSLAVNPLPQPSRWTDPPVLKEGENANKYNTETFLSPYYSEMYDDHQQVVYFRFGVPVFNSITGFYSRFYSPSYGRFVRTGGLVSSLTNSIGQLIGQTVTLPLGIVSLGLSAVGIIGDTIDKIGSFLSGKTSQLYYLKPTMPLYWSAAQGILNHIAVNKGFLAPRVGGDKHTTTSNQDRDWTPSGAELEYLKSNFGSIITDKGNINLYGVATRAQRAYMKQLNDLNASGSSDLKREMINRYKSGIKASYRNVMDPHITNLKNATSRWFGSSLGQVTGDPNEGLIAKEASTDGSDPDSFMSIVKAGLHDGAEFVGFRVTTTGGAQESFSNSFKESELAQWINNTSSAARSFKFSANYGNIGDNAVANGIEGMVSGAMTNISKFAEQIGMGGLFALTGSAYAEVPKFWDRADAQLSTKSYTIDLISPYGDVFSQLINIYMPLSLLLAGSLTRSTGRHSYTEPFLCQVFDKGRAQTRLGMVKSISINRGSTGNVSWTQYQEPLNIRVTLDIEDMETMLHMPMVENMGGAEGMLKAGLDQVAGIFKGPNVLEGGWFDFDSPFSDYMAVLGSLDMTAQIYFFPKLVRKWRERLARQDSTSNASYWGMMASNNPIADIAKLFVPGTFPR